MMDKVATLNQQPATSNQQPATSNQQPATSNQQPATSNNYALVSIIIPAYNTAPYIHRAIESSQRQTHKNIEIIIVDDGSTDDTLKVAERYALQYERVRVYHQENGGVSSARNHGMREAKGEYYVFLDSDDWFEDDAIEVLLDAQRKYPDRFIAATFFDVSPKMEKLNKRQDFPQLSFMNINEIAECLAGMRKSPCNFMSSCGKLFSADAIRDGITFPEGIAHSEDMCFVFEYLFRTGGNTICLNRPIMNILARPGSAQRSTHITENAKKALHSHMAVYDMMIERYKDIPELLTCVKFNAIGQISSSAINPALTRAENKIAKKWVMQYAKEYLTCKKMPFRKKLLLMCRVYLPMPLSRIVSKAILAAWKMLKKIRDTIRQKK